MKAIRFHHAALGALAAAPLLLTAAGCQRAANSHAATSPSSHAAPTVRVSVGKPQRKTLVLSTTQPARIEAFEETPIFSKLAGYVEQVHVDIGDNVSRDQPLVTLRVPELVDDVAQKAALVAQAEAEVKQAQANVEMANAAVDTAHARIAEAEAGTTRADGEHERWKGEYDRVKELAAKGSVSQKLADETLNQLRAAEASRAEAGAAVQSAEADARQARANVAKAEADRIAADAHLGVARADLAHAKTMLSYASIRSPFDGIVTKRSIDTGHFVQPAGGGDAHPLLVVACLDKVRVYVEVPEMEAAAVDVGDPATLHIQALADKEIFAPVVRTSWSLDPSNRSLRAEVDVPNENSLLRPGMYATGTIELASRKNALVVPISAVVRVGAAAYCCCVADGKIERRPVELGLRSGPEVEVLSGLNETSTIVVRGADALEQHQQVEVIEP